MDSPASRHYLTFSLAGELYGLPVSAVREVLEYRRLTRLPRSPDFLKGVLELRGTGIPVIDLRLRFRLEARAPGAETGIIVVELAGREGPLVLGAIADKVLDLIELPEEAVERTPGFGSRLAPEFIRGLGRREGELLILLDIDRIFSLGELEKLAAAAEADLETAVADSEG